MTQLTGSVQVVGQNLFSSSADKLHKLGETVFANNGNVYRFCKAGGTALVPGKLQQSKAETTANQDLTAVAASIGDLSISASTTITATANQYAEGWAMITVTPGQGQQYTIKNHAAYTAAAPTFTLEDSVKVALTTSSRIDLVENPYSAIIVHPTTATSSVAGVAIFAIAASEFGWVQVGGVANCLADGANAVGATLVASNAVAGAVEDAASPGAQGFVGVAVTGAADTEYGAVKLLLV